MVCSRLYGAALATMKFSSLFFLGATAIVGAAAQDENDKTRESTYFNGIKVPPPMELSPENFEQATHASKWLMVKHYRCAPDRYDVCRSVI